MEEKASEIIGFTPGALWTTIGVLISVAIIALLVMNLISKYRELRKPKLENKKTVEDMLNNDNKRLNDLEDITKEQQKEMRLILQSQVAMLHHMVDGNNTEALKQSQKAIEKYLLTGRVND